MLNFNELEKKLDQALNGETPDSLKDWLKQKRKEEQKSLVALLNKKAEYFEKQALTQTKLGNIHAMHELMDAARCFRMCAGFLDKD